MSNYKLHDNYDIIIIGGGSAGCGAAYALRETCLKDNLKVLLIDQYPLLGGTSTNAWVNCFAATPDAPYMEPVFQYLLKNNEAKYVDENYQDIEHLNNYNNTLLHKNYTKDNIELSICVSPIALSNKYESDLKQSNIQIIKECKFINVSNVENGYVKEIIIRIGTKDYNIKSKIFIDSSGNDVLFRSALDPASEGIDYYIGRDSNDRYQQSHGFHEKSAGSDNQSEDLNLPTLMYRITKGKENLPIEPLFGEDAVLYSSPDNKYIYVNSISLLSDKNSGILIIKNGENYVKKMISPRIIYHWKQIKISQKEKLQKWNLQNKKYDNTASMLGIRETYRANCERILNENSLTIPFYNYKKETDNLNRIIAIGNHPVDIHTTQGIKPSIKVIPYGVPYGCLIPKKLKNVLIASRGAGFTHLAAASFRLNKDMGQIGWAAGKAALQYLHENLNDFRTINVETLWEKMDFHKTINKISILLNSEYCKK